MIIRPLLFFAAIYIIALSSVAQINTKEVEHQTFEIPLGTYISSNNESHSATGEQGLVKLNTAKGGTLSKYLNEKNFVDLSAHEFSSKSNLDVHKKQWYLDVSFGRFTSRYGNQNLPYEDYVNYIMKDDLYKQGSSLEIPRATIAVRRELKKWLSAGLSISYFLPSHRHQLSIYRNTVQLTDREVEIWDTSDHGFSTRFLQIGVPIQFRMFNNLTFDLMPILATNVSGKPNTTGLSGNYNGLFDNSNYISKHIGFGHAAIGYEFMGFFIKAFYERNFTKVSSTFPIFGEPFTITYPKWENYGINIGASIRLSEKPFLLYNRM